MTATTNSSLDDRSETRKAHAAMLAFAAIIAGSFSLGDLAAPYMEPAALNSVRFLFATFIMLAIGLAFHKEAPIVKTGLWRFLILGGLSAIYFIAMFVALQLTEPVSTGAVLTLAPLMSAGFGWLLLGQRVSLQVMAGLLLAAVGALWVIFGGDWEAIKRFNVGQGEAIFFFGCIAYAAYAPMVRRLNRGEDAYPFTFMTLVGCMLITGAFGSVELFKTVWSSLPAIVWLAIAYLALFATAGSFFLVQYASLRLPAAKVLSYKYLVPGFIILYEGLLGHGWAGLSVALGAGLAAAALAYTMLFAE